MEKRIGKGEVPDTVNLIPKANRAGIMMRSHKWKNAVPHNFSAIAPIATVLLY